VPWGKFPGDTSAAKGGDQSIRIDLEGCCCCCCCSLLLCRVTKTTTTRERSSPVHRAPSPQPMIPRHFPARRKRRRFRRRIRERPRRRRQVLLFHWYPTAVASASFLVAAAAAAADESLRCCGRLVPFRGIHPRGTREDSATDRSIQTNHVHVHLPLLLLRFPLDHPHRRSRVRRRPRRRRLLRKSEVGVGSIRHPATTIFRGRADCHYDGEYSRSSLAGSSPWE
jgi:hypothetical protein